MCIIVHLFCQFIIQENYYSPASYLILNPRSSTVQSDTNINVITRSVENRVLGTDDPVSSANFFILLIGPSYTWITSRLKCKYTTLYHFSANSFSLPLKWFYYRTNFIYYIKNIAWEFYLFSMLKSGNVNFTTES